ncbi:Putative membrane protein YfjD [hydrothermal vent metagenome]|uniref:Membrane protein YfjD n=1 Tax=hydrothermal vent metagenome TaxID=652676 RepID=A0A3B0ZK70_9ZZZZ
MNDIPLATLFITIFILILFSAFFSSTETAMMSINRYRLRHRAKMKHPGALRVQTLLDRPDRLIGLILLGNNFVNILASAIATMIALRLLGEGGIAISTAILTIVILIFAEVTPKTLAAMYPERFAYPASYIYIPLLKTFYPIVWLISIITNGLFKLMGIRKGEGALQQLSRDELRTVVNEAGALIPQRHQQMLVGILDLEKATVEDIMVPRSEIVGIDLEDNWNTILSQLSTSQHTRLPIYNNDIDGVVGMIHMRNILHHYTSGDLNADTLIQLASKPFFVPQGTSLNNQLLNFQKNKHRTGLVVDEYGDILGLVTLEDILEEIVGEFTTDVSVTSPDVHKQSDDSYLVTGTANIREINRTMKWHLPTEGPKTINGLVLEHLESIPVPGTSLLIENYPFEIVQTAENAVKMVRILPRLSSEHFR